MTAAATSATFSDFKIVKGRRVAMLVFEVALEQADAALIALGGVPRPDAEVWVAIARLDPKAAQKPAQEPAQAVEKQRQRFEDLPYSQQAVLRCNDARYRRFLASVGGFTTQGIAVLDADMAAEAVREFCGVSSRSEIIAFQQSGVHWDNLEKDYADWLASQRYPEMTR